MPAELHKPAPNFSAEDQQGKIHSLTDYRGQYVLLYFYPEDDTPGCTREACHFRDNFEALRTRANIFGVSADDKESHEKFAQKYNLPFPLLTDPGEKMLSAYGADGKTFAKRSSFLIDREGIVAKIYDRVNPDTHAKDVRRDLEALE